MAILTDPKWCFGGKEVSGHLFSNYSARSVADLSFEVGIGIVGKTVLHSMCLSHDNILVHHSIIKSTAIQFHTHELLPCFSPISVL